ncbi:MAG: HD domain-containing phosphohydrolase [Solibacillus sp.]
MNIQQLENKVSELTNLLEAFKQLNSHIEIQEVFENILWQMVTVVKAEAGTLWVVDKTTEEVVATAAHGVASSTILNVRMKKGEGIVGKVITSGAAELIEDVTKHPSWAQRVDDKSQFVTKSMITVPLSAKGHVLGALQLINKKEIAFFNEEDISLAVTLANQSALAIHNSQMYEEIHLMFLSMIKTLVKSLDARDPYTAGHSERVAKYSVWIAERLGLDEAACDQLYKAALLHDIGKIGIPDHILLKHGRLTDEEFDTIKQHTVIGASILSNMEPKNSLTYAIQTARSHHEKMNGAGYPDGLKGEEIPLFARIVGVADAFDAMTTVRPYSNGLSYEKATEELIRCKDFMFDASVVDAFIAILKEINYEVDNHALQNKHKKTFFA